MTVHIKNHYNSNLQIWALISSDLPSLKLQAFQSVNLGINAISKIEVNNMSLNMSLSIWDEDIDMKAYHEMEEKLIKEHHGKVAVFCDGKLIAIGNNIKEAVLEAKKHTKKRNFFVRELYTVKEQSECILNYRKLTPYPLPFNQ
ncbi:MAG: hypothetical protein ACE5KE_12215 [Methanosarcinales archaeon]